VIVPEVARVLRPGRRLVFNHATLLHALCYDDEDDLQSDRLNYNSLKIQLSQSLSDLDLFKTYDFSKQTQKLLSDYFESKRALDRTYAKTRSELAQAKARLESAKARFELQQERLTKTQNQLAACTIRAPGPGLVVYGSSLEPMQRFRGGSNTGLIAPANRSSRTNYH
jgi:multidrug efflux pump subunit AcrA (membrane-fusion protein)